MIEVQNLIKWYGPTLAIEDLSFGIEPGQIVGFLGPNGAGKSTTLRILTGFLPPTSGRAMIAGHDVLAESMAVRDKIGYLPENTPLYQEMRVEEYLHYRGKLHGMDREARRKQINVVADRCGLTAMRRRVIGHLSRGNKQRLGIAQSLLHNPPVLILDEPTAGLDPNQISHVRDLIRELRGQHTILVSTHILPEVEKVADRVMIIAAGRIVADGTPQELRQSVATGQRMLIEVEADANAVANAIRQAASVGNVETSTHEGWCRAIVTPTHNQDLREPLGRLILSHGWPIREMRLDVASLEQFFVQITAKQDQASHPAA